MEKAKISEYEKYLPFQTGKIFRSAGISAVCLEIPFSDCLGLGNINQLPAVAICG